MLEKLILYTQSIVSAGGPTGVFAAALLEEIIFFIPSPIVPLAAGFFLLSPSIQLTEAIAQAFLYIALPVALGLTIGSLLPYCICYFGGRPAIKKWGHFIGLTWENIEKIEKHFIHGNHDELILIGLRILPVVPSVAISSFCGLVRYPVYRFLAVTALGAALRGFLLGLAGWYAGTAYLKFAHAIARIETYLFILVGAVSMTIVIWFVRKKHKKHYEPH